MPRAGLGFVTRSAGAERRGGALADVIVSIRSRTAELIRGPAGDSFGLARQGGRGGLRGRSRTRLSVQELLQRSRCQPSAKLGEGWSTGGVCPRNWLSWASCSRRSWSHDGACGVPHTGAPRLGPRTGAAEVRRGRALSSVTGCVDGRGGLGRPCCSGGRCRVRGACRSVCRCLGGQVRPPGESRCFPWEYMAPQ